MTTNHNTLENKSTDSNKKMTSRQIVAIIGIALLVLMYIATLVVAIVDTSASGKWFGMCLTATFVIPVLIWIYTWMYGKFTNKSTIADLNIGGENHVTDEEVRDILIAQATAETEAENQ